MQWVLVAMLTHIINIIRTQSILCIIKWEDIFENLNDGILISITILNIIMYVCLIYIMSSSIDALSAMEIKPQVDIVVIHRMTHIMHYVDKGNTHLTHKRKHTYVHTCNMYPQC